MVDNHAHWFVLYRENKMISIFYRGDRLLAVLPVVALSVLLFSSLLDYCVVSWWGNLFVLPVVEIPSGHAMQINVKSQFMYAELHIQIIR